MARVGRNASCGLPPHWCPRPRAEKRDNGSSMVAQLSRPWSNSSPVREGERGRYNDERGERREEEEGKRRESERKGGEMRTTAMDGWEGGSERE